MRRFRLAIGIMAVALVWLFVADRTVQVQQAVPARGGSEQNGGYAPVEGWPKQVHKGWVWGAVEAVFAESPDRVIIGQRGWLPELGRPKNTPIPQFGPSLSFPVNQVPFRNASQGPVGSPPNPNATNGITKDGVDYLWKDVIYIVNRNGEKITEEAWAQWDSLLKRPHGIYENPYDPEKHVWVVDDGPGHAVYKFTNDGKSLVLTLGVPGEPGADDEHFDGPTFLAWLPDSTMFVADGYQNSRVMKFDKDGKFLMKWGERGERGKETRPGYFNTVHGIAVDAQRRVYVNDRDNRRIQVFDEFGKFLDEWTIGIAPAIIYNIYMAADQTLWAMDAGQHRIYSWDLTGKYKSGFGYLGDPPGGLFSPHQISVDQEGNLYIAQVANGYTAKWVPLKGADPAKLVGKPLGFPWAR